MSNQSPPPQLGRGRSASASKPTDHGPAGSEMAGLSPSPADVTPRRHGFGSESLPTGEDRPRPSSAQRSDQGPRQPGLRAPGQRDCPIPAAAQDLPRSAGDSCLERRYQGIHLQDGSSATGEYGRPSSDASGRATDESKTLSMPEDASSCLDEATTTRSRTQRPLPYEPAVVTCINTPEPFPTTWYAHPDTPGFHVCSKCYNTLIRGTIFEDAFHGQFFNDGEPRVCRFSKPRIREHLSRVSIATKKLDDLVRYMTKRSPIPNCKGSVAVKASEGIVWYTADKNAIPDMVVCQACYEDHIMSRHLAAKFIVCPNKQGEDEAWSCHFAIPFIRKQYYKDADVNDWQNFCKQTTERLNIPPCPESTVVYAGHAPWYKPARNLDMLLICQACHYDFVLHSGQDMQCCYAGTADTIDGGMLCGLGQPNLFFAMTVAEELEDSDVFWRAAETASREPICNENGTANAKWYTIPSASEEFNICGRCFACVAKPLRIDQSFVPAETDADAELVCSFSRGDARSASYVRVAREAFYNCRSRIFEDYVLECSRGTHRSPRPKRGSRQRPFAKLAPMHDMSA